ncbi:carbohydrate kinase [bacterium]|nr:carbohydrate kinase [bacterium]
MSGEILCLGEVLWDALPSGLFLGGAPYNVASHLREAGQQVRFASRVGDDELGREVLRRLTRSGLVTDLVQVDKHLPTGFVIVDLDSGGSPTFDVVQPSAWDAIEVTHELQSAAAQARALVFGSLAQRSEVSRATIQTLIRKADYTVFDINLRPPFDDLHVVADCLPCSKVVKMNDHEQALLGKHFGFSGSKEDQARNLAERFGIESVCVTCGADGACLLHQGSWLFDPGFRVQVADAVGAGDSFLATLLAGLLAGVKPSEALRRANAVGAFVASQNGATPPHDREAIGDLMAVRKEPIGK